MNVIDETTKKEELEKEYSNYPSVLNGESLTERPWMWNRLGPLFYEAPFGSKILDVGANTGEFVELLKKERGCESYGIDISEVCVKQAQEKGRNVQLSDGHKIPFEDASFDVVFLNEVLVHVFNPVEVLQEIKRVLKPTGFLLGSSPHKNLQRNVWEEKFSHRDYYDTDGLAKLLDSVFEKVYIQTLTGAQFAFTMAHSSVGHQEAELLFKCGGDKTNGFGEALLDKSVLRVWFGFTQPPGTVYYRMSGFADKMREKGAEIAYEPFDHNDLSSPGDWERKVRWKHVQHQLDAILRCADISVWQIIHNLESVAFLRCVKDLFKKPIWTEIDDWLFDVPSYNAASNPYKPNSDYEWAAFQQIELSDGLIVSTEFLKESLSELFPGKKIHVIKNCVDFKIWDNLTPFLTIPEKKEGVVRVGYTGCGNHSGDLELIKKPMLALLEEFENLEFVFPLQLESLTDIQHERVIYLNKWLPLPQYFRAVKSWDLDIGIAPLRDNNLNRAKSNLRWLEYSALKVPSVLSKVRPFEECIVQGKNGYLCNSQKDWYERLKTLIENKKERIRIGMNAYRDVKKNWNMDKVSKEYLDLLKTIQKEARK